MNNVKNNIMDTVNKPQGIWDQFPTCTADYVQNQVWIMVRDIVCDRIKFQVYSNSYEKS